VRATALGVAYAALGAATALAPALLSRSRPASDGWPSFLLAAVLHGHRVLGVRRRVPTPVAAICAWPMSGHGIWAFGLLAITGGVVGIGTDPDSVIRKVLIGWAHAAGRVPALAAPPRATSEDAASTFAG